MLGSTLNIIGMMTKLIAEGKCFYYSKLYEKVVELKIRQVIEVVKK